MTSRSTAPRAAAEPLSGIGYFERIDTHRYKPTQHASGAWNADEIHFSPLGGLIVHAIDLHRIDRHRAGAPRSAAAAATASTLALGRISFDILGFLPLDECEIRVETVRPGRTIELVEATVTIADRQVVAARAWFLAATDTAVVAGGAVERLPAPQSVDPFPLDSVWSGGYIASLRFHPTKPPRPGRTTAWVSTDVQLVAGEACSPQATFLSQVDVANGIAVRQPPDSWMFPNVDLTIHLHRQPEDRWTGLDTTVVFGPGGLGVTTSVLHDVHGPVGIANQLLTVRRQPES